MFDVMRDSDAAEWYSNVQKSQYKHNIAVAIQLNDITNVIPITDICMLTVRALGITKGLQAAQACCSLFILMIILFFFLYSVLS